MDRGASPLNSMPEMLSVSIRAIPLRSYIMAEYVAKRDPKRCPTHPGELLREVVIPATGKTRSEIAALLGISRQHLYDILNERKPVSPTVAVRLG